ncbi:LOW QUALITY PROTEIN: hypothetical protein HID58_040895 [Brassica napus]|uniref:Uncharacterized protein n=1 Tax=Brassica napus TaxID=3708 RepID=A0ABQ8B9B5_BRANA|nr:LOW QUALITY PROTEIN: hypothetical protein HID58_040895 [Brassica napus]
MDVGVKAHGLAKKIGFFPAVREETVTVLRPPGIELGESGVREFEMVVEKDLVVEGEIRREAMLGRGMARQNMVLHYPGVAEQSCLILWSPHTGERNLETLRNTIMANLQRLVSDLNAEAHNVNKGGDLMAVYIALVDEKGISICVSPLVFMSYDSYLMTSVRTALSTHATARFIN